MHQDKETLRFIKTYLRSTQERLTNLAMISIEQEICENFILHRAPKELSDTEYIYVNTVWKETKFIILIKVVFIVKLSPEKLLLQKI